MLVFRDGFFVKGVVHEPMKAPQALLSRIAEMPAMSTGSRRLIVVMGQLGDFDSVEYAQALVPRLEHLRDRGIVVQAFAIGSDSGAERFCRFTGFPPSQLQVDSRPDLHQALELQPGLQLPGGPWPGFLMMCAGIRSPGTLQEVIRGYTGDRSASQLFADEDRVEAFPLPAFEALLFRRAGGSGFLRPFELATQRLRNMNEVLSHWRTYVPSDDYITQRGGTFLLEKDDTTLYVHRDSGLLGYSETMNRPLAFLDPYLD